MSPEDLPPPGSLTVTDRGWLLRDYHGRRWLVRDVRERERPVVYRVPDTDRAATHRLFVSHDGFRLWIPLPAMRTFLARIGLGGEYARVTAVLGHTLARYTPRAVTQAIDRRDLETGRFHIGPGVDDPRRAQTRAAGELRRMARERRTWDTT